MELQKSEMCSVSEKSFKHFMSCNTYGKVSCEIGWKEIFLNNVETKYFLQRKLKEDSTKERKEL